MPLFPNSVFFLNLLKEEVETKTYTWLFFQIKVLFNNIWWNKMWEAYYVPKTVLGIGD